MAGITDDDLILFWVRPCDDIIFLLIWCNPIKNKKQKNLNPLSTHNNNTSPHKIEFKF